MMPLEEQNHTPVLLSEVLNILDIKEGETFIDGTYGRGGYSQGILQAKSQTHVIALDRDPEAIAHGQKTESSFEGRFRIVSGCFGNMKVLLHSQGLESVNGIVLDVGVSSTQIDDPKRGFSFRYKGPLDMRMSKEGQTAADIVNNFQEEELANLIYTLGEERFSRRIARKIVEMRQQKSFENTQDLANVIRSVVPRHKDGIDPATRTFQALRIYVNDELNELQRALDHSITLLKEGGRLVVVSFHSLEDRCVKHFLREKSQGTIARSRYEPPLLETKEPVFKLITRRPICASPKECELNPRSRSAKLRAAQRLSNCLKQERRKYS